jgi:CubicO group peptidase (beta-lactamase class C family)
VADVLQEIEDWEPDTVAVGVTDASTTLGGRGAVDTVLPFASLTKPLSAYAVLIAVQDGVLHLDEPLGEEAPAPEATVRHLLAHAGGLPLDEDGGPVQRVGQRRVYSNWGYELLGELVASRVGHGFAEHLDHEVLAPLGMTSTRLKGSPAHAAEGTVTDLLAFARELLDPQLLDPELHAEATTATFPTLEGVVPGYGRQSPNEWGLGPEIKGTKDPHWTGSRQSATTFGHFGRSGSFIWVDPELGLASAELADTPFGEWSKRVWPAFNDRVVETFGA